jgi:MYXO-CTERM domain-containing protein
VDVHSRGLARSRIMNPRALAPACLVAGVLVAARASAADYYVASSTGNPGGSDTNTGSETAPFKTIQKAASVAAPGDTVYLRGGTYAESVVFSTSGKAGSWITFSAYPGELPILDGAGASGTGFSSSVAQYIRVVGIAARNWKSSGFGNGWVNDTGTSNGNWQFVNCIADGNGINGITFYNASGLLIDESIVVHNGNQPPSWSSGVNLFHLSGDYTTNIVRRTVSFENIDICGAATCANKSTDGSGFILDQNSSGALFENNIGFRNGGSCIRINCPGAHIVNNTCYHDGLNSNDTGPAAPGEIYFSSALAGAVMANNLAAASGWNNTMNAFVGGPAGSNDVAINMNGPTPFFMNPAGIDFRVVAGSPPVIDKGTTANAPSTDIGFDPKCITQSGGAAGAPSWWANAIDYVYIAKVGGVAGCFHPAVRPQGAGPDIGAYESGGRLADAGAGGSSGVSGSGSGGGSSGGSGSGSGGSSSSGAAGSSGGISSGGSGAARDAGSHGSAGGSSSGSVGPSGGSTGSSGGFGGSSSGELGSRDPASGSDAGSAGDSNAPAGGGAGCACRAGPPTREPFTWALGGVVVLAVGSRRRRVARRER